MRKVLLSVGLSIHIIYIVLAILSLGDYEYSGHGIGKAFAFWIYAMMIAMPVVGIYLVEGILSFVKHRNRVNFLKLVAVGILVPLHLYVGSSAGTVQFVVWNTYFLMIFAIQIVFLFIKPVQK